MVTLLASIVVLVGSALLFRAALPQEGKTRWFVGTNWEPYIVVALVVASVVSLGLTVLSIRSPGALVENNLIGPSPARH
jgi:hypothetical protein